MTISAPHDGKNPRSRGEVAVSDETMEESRFPRETASLHEKIATDCDRLRPESTQRPSVYAPRRLFNNSDSRDLYFVRNPYLNIIKVGIASDVAARLWTLECACGVPLELLRVLPQGASYEPHLHEVLSATRLFGEWFLPSAELLNVIENPAAILECLAYSEDRRRSA